MPDRYCEACQVLTVSIELVHTDAGERVSKEINPKYCANCGIEFPDEN